MPLLAGCLTAIDVVDCCFAHGLSPPNRSSQPSRIFAPVRRGPQSASHPTRRPASTLIGVEQPAHALSGAGLAAASWGRNQPAPISSSTQRQRPRQQQQQRGGTGRRRGSHYRSTAARWSETATQLADGSGSPAAPDGAAARRQRRQLNSTRRRRQLGSTRRRRSSHYSSSGSSTVAPGGDSARLTTAAAAAATRQLQTGPQLPDSSSDSRAVRQQQAATQLA